MSLSRVLLGLVLASSTPVFAAELPVDRLYEDLGSSVLPGDCALAAPSFYGSAPTRDLVFGVRRPSQPDFLGYNPLYYWIGEPGEVEYKGERFRGSFEHVAKNGVTETRVVSYRLDHDQAFPGYVITQLLRTNVKLVRDIASGKVISFEASISRRRRALFARYWSSVQASVCR